MTLQGTPYAEGHGVKSDAQSVRSNFERQMCYRELSHDASRYSVRLKVMGVVRLKVMGGFKNLHQLLF